MAHNNSTTLAYQTADCWHHKVTTLDVPA